MRKQPYYPEERLALSSLFPLRDVIVQCVGKCVRTAATSGCREVQVVGNETTSTGEDFDNKQ